MSSSRGLSHALALGRDRARLRFRHGSTGRGRDFKTWLREEYHVSISQKTLKKAVTGLDQMTDALIALQEAVLVAAEMASRDRGLSVTE